MLEREGKFSAGLTDRVEQPMMETPYEPFRNWRGQCSGSVLPNPGKAGLYPGCGVSHEALDFFDPLGLALFETLMEGSEFKALLSRLGYTHRNQ